METLYHAVAKQDNDLEEDYNNITDDKVLETFLNEERIILKKIMNKLLHKSKESWNLTKTEKEYKYDAVWDNINN
tara:strand:- start:92 stop:316 length:225 start_codon:yes stop_codon:yes gene_type:complete